MRTVTHAESVANERELCIFTGIFALIRICQSLSPLPAQFKFLSHTTAGSPVQTTDPYGTVTICSGFGTFVVQTKILIIKRLYESELTIKP